jgi:rhamnose utilization protein RhaD (predicted bifunctional aldolase and dehydrogenase)
MNCLTEITDLLALSARIGRNPLLAQASNGNTSIKLGGTLWIKASGKWLAHAADEEILVPLRLSELRSSLQRDVDFHETCADSRDAMRPSIETAMHAVLPHRVVIHAHSVNTISWAVRRDGEQRLLERLEGLRWQWIPFVPSGVPLARSIQRAIAGSSDSEATDVFVLANHGLVVCGESCGAAEERLREVEKRLAVAARPDAECSCSLPPEVDSLPRWRLPETGQLHALGIDAISRKILRGGILYPCQAVFLGTRIPFVPASLSLPKIMERCENEKESDSPCFSIVEGRGVIVRRGMTKTQQAILNGLFDVVQRIEESAPIRYVSNRELDSLMSQDAHGYRQCAELGASRA